MQLQPRDREVLRALHQHRYLTRCHIHELTFAGAHVSVVTRRLRLLWANRLVDRYFFPLDFSARTRAGLRTPVYTLASKGAQIVGEQIGLAMSQIPHTPAQNRQGYRRLQHNLVATDLLVAVQAAAPTHPSVFDVRIEPEPLLWRRARSAERQQQHVYSDGSFTIVGSTGKQRSFHVEVVRADIRAGSSTLLAKLKRYSQLVHTGYFERVHDQPCVRAVLIAAPTKARAQNLRDLAGELTHGKNLFWFSHWEREPSIGPPITTFAPSTVFSPMWTDISGRARSILGDFEQQQLHV